MKRKGTSATMAASSNRIAVRVVPNARKTEIAGYADGVVRVRLRAPAVEGRANEELIRFLAAVFGIRRSRVVIVRGATSREKGLEIEGWEGKEESAEAFVARWAEQASGPEAMIR